MGSSHTLHRTSTREINESPLTVSVAMCTHNGARFLREQLDSLAAQTHLPTELVICDDISTDETINIIKEFSIRSPFGVKLIINEERLFFHRNFVKAATLCSSDIIAFCDQDDVWMPEKLATILPFFADNEVMLVSHQATIIDEFGIEIAPRLPDADFLPIYNRLCCRPWNFSRGFTQVLRSQINRFASLHEMTEGFSAVDPYASHDIWAQLISNSFGKVLWIESPLAKYRQHNNNLFGIKAIDIESKNFDVLQSNFQYFRRASIISNVFDSAEHLSDLIDLKNFIINSKKHWMTLSKMFYLRHNIYNSQNKIHRIRCFLSLLKLGAYGARGRWSFSLKSILKDAFISVFNFNNYSICRDIISLRQN